MVCFCFCYQCILNTTLDMTVVLHQFHAFFRLRDITVLLEEARQTVSRFSIFMCSTIVIKDLFSLQLIIFFLCQYWVWLVPLHFFYLIDLCLLFYIYMTKELFAIKMGNKIRQGLYCNTCQCSYSCWVWKLREKSLLDCKTLQSKIINVKATSAIKIKRFQVLVSRKKF